MPDKTTTNIEFIPEVDPTIKDAYVHDELVLFIGSGISRRLGAPGWAGFADAIFEQLAYNPKSEVNHNLLNQIKNYPPRKKLSFALELAEGIVDLDFERAILPKEIDTGSLHIYDYLNQLKCNVVTTNYDNFLHEQPNDDSLILPNLSEEESKGIGKREIIHRRSDINGVTLNKDKHKIIHLHGCLDHNKNEDLVITTSDYLRLYEPSEDNNILKFLRSLFRDGPWTILFIGYGLDEMEILEYLLRHDSNNGENEEAIIDRFWLKGFYSHQEEEFNLLRTYYRKNFKVKVIPFCLDKNKYTQLDLVIENWVRKLQIAKHSTPENVVHLVRKINKDG